MKSLRKIHPFRWLLFLWMGLVYIWGSWAGLVKHISTTEILFNGGSDVGPLDLRKHTSTAEIIIFSVLMVVHTGIYWIGITRMMRRRWQLLFFTVQGALVLVISLVSNDAIVTLGLYLALIGMPVGIVRDVRMASAVVIGYVVLFGLDVGLWALFGMLSSGTARLNPPIRSSGFASCESALNASTRDSSAGDGPCSRYTGRCSPRYR